MTTAALHRLCTTTGQAVGYSLTFTNGPTPADSRDTDTTGSPAP